jgi:hypothetical protein
MEPFRDWSFVRVMLVCAGWVVLGLALIALWIFRQITWTADIGSGSGIETVHFSINASLMLIPSAPPVVLLFSWLWLRRRR